MTDSVDRSEEEEEEIMRYFHIVKEGAMYKEGINYMSMDSQIGNTQFKGVQLALCFPKKQISYQIMLHRIVKEEKS